TELGVAFVNERDQQVYRIDIGLDGGAHGAPYLITDQPPCRYGDLSFVPAWQALLAVEESHETGAVVHRLVRIGLSGHRQVLIEGADFYAAPVADPSGQRLAWIEWDRPYQPWGATRLCQRGSGERTRVLAGEAGDRSLQ